jgi:uroporphyrinogen-III synthase
MSSLSGKRIAVTRAAEQAVDLAARLAALGAEPLICPLIACAPPQDLAPLDEVVGHLAAYDWLVLPSANAATALLERLAARGLPAEELKYLYIAAVGPATAAACEARGLHAELVPAVHTAAGLLAELDDLGGRRVLLPHSDIARPELADGLRERGATVDAVVAYRTLPGPGAAVLLDALRQGAVDAVTFASPSAVRGLLAGLQAKGLSSEAARELLAGVALVAIGPTTAAALRDAGLPVAEVAAPHTAEGLARAIAVALRNAAAL